MNNYLLLILESLIPAAFCILAFFVFNKTKFSKISVAVKQIIIGVLFGAVGILCNEIGVIENNALLNVTLISPLIAGLIFGWPAGLISGFIAGIERAIAVNWGVSSFTAIAESISIILSGIYSGACRKYIFEERIPSPIMGALVSIVIQVVQMLLIFITNFSQPINALNAIDTCFGPMTVAQAFGLAITCFLLWIIKKEKLINKSMRLSISSIIQRWLLISIIFAFALTSFFLFSYQNALSTSTNNTLLASGVDDIVLDITGAADKSLLGKANEVKNVLKSGKQLKEIAEDWNLTEINLVNNEGIIYDSTDQAFINYDMHSGTQSSQFLVLLGDTPAFVQPYGPISKDSTIYRKYAGVKLDVGFLQVGYDQEKFHDDIAIQVSGLTKNRHIGYSGYSVIYNRSTGELVSAPNYFDKKIVINVNDKLENKNYLVTIGNENAYIRYRVSEDYNIVSILPEAEANRSRNISIYFNTFIQIIIYAILFSVVYMLIKKVIISKLKMVNNSLSKITSGNLSEIVDVNDNLEFADLSADINETVSTLKKYIDDASARIDKELEMAKQIQQSALPPLTGTIMENKAFDIYACMFTAKEVGGDFYDFYTTIDNRLNILIADVSGKGIPAAMFMMRAKAGLKSLVETGNSIDAVFTKSNETLSEGNDYGMFLTAWQGSIDLFTGDMEFVNAGHNQPVIRRKGGKFEYFNSKAELVLAGLDNTKYTLQSSKLNPGDILFLYTDGVTESTNIENKLYGEQRLLDILNAQEITTMEALTKAVKDDIDEFVGKASQFDDITMLALRFNGPEPIKQIYFEKAVIDNIIPITEFIEEELNNVGASQKTIIQINVAIDEIVSNIIHYGYKDKPGPITVRFKYKSNIKTIYINFIDEGIPYNPLNTKEPDTSLSGEERQIGGLGIYMVKKSMDDILYRYEGGKNFLTIVKQNNQEKD